MINPLPKRFHNETFKPHVLVRKNYGNVEELHECSHNVPRSSIDNQKLNKHSEEIETNSVIVQKNRIKRDTNIENPVFIETAVFVDRDLFDHMKNNYPVDTERELIRFVLAMINAVRVLIDVYL